MAWKRWLLVCACSALWVAGCSSTTVSGTEDGGASEAGALDGGTRDGSARDAGGDAALDARPGDVDARPGDPDAGVDDVDASTGDVDASTGDVDATTGDPDAATTVVDAGPAPVDAGSDAGNLRPMCTITAPLAGAVQDYDDDFVFVASASDPEDGALTGVSIVWRSDRVVAPLGSGLSVTALLEPGAHTITCTATDSNGDTGTGSLMVTSRSPVAEILHPGDGETRSATATFPFSGRARDFEDGTLTGASLVWTSSIDGLIGTGLTFTRGLSAGTNVVTLTVTDSDGNVGTDVITLTITP